MKKHTYAPLLYASGNKAEAIITQQEAVNKSKASDADNTSSFEETLQQMQAGKR